RVSVNHVAHKILALLGFRHAAEFLHASLTLNSDAQYRAAAGTLPHSAKVPLYLNFSSLAPLIPTFAEFQGESVRDPSVTKAKQTVEHHLRYAIVGTTPTDDRLVIGLK
ncbi:MAG: hypothetical protein J2O48_08665, partial [Solirubrobacterales bacterium]|nr:hypothetical protein [Solirubrobacterales bacterium]